ncbi:MAG: hypothetical protein ACRCVW_01215, partial [Brevinema sp.]
HPMLERKVPRNSDAFLRCDDCHSNDAVMSNKLLSRTDVRSVEFAIDSMKFYQYFFVNTGNLLFLNECKSLIVLLHPVYLLKINEN